MIFSAAGWINHPQSTYLAEHKAIQLNVAAGVGFCVPDTFVANAVPALRAGVRYAVKGLDTVLAHDDAEEYFGFTQLIETSDIAKATLSECPAVIQRGLDPKLDLRVTVIDEHVFSVAITRNGEGIRGDWRVDKSGLMFTCFSLPKEITDLCKKITHKLGLRFAAIDLALVGEDFYFIELNPTGEWAWLVDAAGINLDEAITDALVRQTFPAD